MNLVDINVLIARVDPAHEFHDRSVGWFKRTAPGGWSTCPLIENGFVRILSNPSYPNGTKDPEKARNLLADLTRSVAGHSFIPDEQSILDRVTFPTLTHTSSKQVTDIYLLGLAAAAGIRFCTFDRKIDTSKIPGGANAYSIIA